MTVRFRRTRALAIAAVLAATAAAAQPAGVSVRDGDLVDPSGLPLYTYDWDTMTGMSHCVGVCLDDWSPFKAPAGTMPKGDWTLIRRDDGQLQWAYRTRPLYTYRKDAPGGRAGGAKQDNWRPASAGAEPPK